MNKIILAVAISLSINATEIKTYKNGNTYAIIEKNVIELFKEHVAANKDMIEKKAIQEREKMIKRIENYKPQSLTINLPNAKKEKTYYPEIEYTLKDDVHDSYGKVLYKKGFQFNPLHYISMNDRYIFINYNDKKQREWVKNEKINKDLTARIIITDGKVFDAIKEFEREVFYANDILIDKFKIEAVPSIVEQEQDRVKVKQIKLED